MKSSSKESFNKRAYQTGFLSTTLYHFWLKNNPMIGCYFSTPCSKCFNNFQSFRYIESNQGETMVHPVVHPIIALLAGILILIFPAILNYIVGFYLLIIGILGIFGMMSVA